MLIDSLKFTMNFHNLAHAVQYNDLAWFEKEVNLLSCMRCHNNKTGDTILHLLCRFGRVDVLKLIFSNIRDIDLDLSNFEGKKPLHEAAQFGQYECVNFLLKHDVVVDSLKRADW